MAGIFRAYDIRGIYPDELDEDTAYRIGRAAPAVLPRGPVGVSRDMRQSAPAIKKALVRGLREAGLDVVDLGLLSTGMNYFALGYYGYGGAIQVTASHNPSEYIGMKFNRCGVSPVSYENGLSTLEEILKTDSFPSPETAGSLSVIDTTGGDYRRRIRSLIGEIAPLKIVVDCSDGMAGLEFPNVFEGLPPRVELLNEIPDGTFPHHDPNPLEEESRIELVERVREREADLGVIFDGDADRTAFIDEKGDFIPTDLVTALLAGSFLKNEPGATIVADFRSSWAVEEYIKKLGGRMIRSRVGHSYIKEKMRDCNAVFGGDIAGHYYFRDNYFSETSALTVARMLELMTVARKPISELYRPLRKYFSTGELNYHVENKKEKIEEVARQFKMTSANVSHFDGITVREPEFWLNVRASNTEPLVRFMAEAKSKKTLEKIKNRVEKILLSS